MTVLIINITHNVTERLKYHNPALYRGANKGLYDLLSRTQAGPGRRVKQEQEEISRDHVQTFICLSVVYAPLFSSDVL